MDKKDRLLKAYEYIRYNGVVSTYTDVANKMGSKLTSISSAMNGNPKYMTNNFLKRFALEFNINPNWLLTGEGEMLNVSDEIASMNLLDPVNQNPKVKMVPLISLDALGGFGSNAEQGEEYTEKLIPWENALEGDFAVMLSGTSMMPVIMPGSYVLLRKVEGWREFLEYNILYVLELLDLRRLLKLVQKSDKPGCLTLISYNPNNPPQDIKTSFIGKVFKVVGIKTDFGF